MKSALVEVYAACQLARFYIKRANVHVARAKELMK